MFFPTPPILYNGGGVFYALILISNRAHGRAYESDMEITAGEPVNWGALVAKIVDQTKIPRPIMEYYVLVLRKRDELMSASDDAASRTHEPSAAGEPESLPLREAAEIALDMQAVAATLETFLDLKPGKRPLLRDGLGAIEKLFREGYFRDADVWTRVARGDFERIERLSSDLNIDVGLPIFLTHSALKTHLQPLLRREADGRNFSSWRQGLCPVCGSRPHLAYSEGTTGEKTLCCSLCDQQWTVEATYCPWCGKTETTMERIVADPLENAWAEACDACDFYLKVTASRSSALRQNGCLDDLATMRLDYAAIERGYLRRTSIPS